MYVCSAAVFYSDRAPSQLTPTRPLVANSQVDKSKFATNAFDKEFLLGKTFGGSGGRYNPNEDRRKGES